MQNPESLFREPDLKLKASVLLAVAWGVFEDEQWLNSAKAMRRLTFLAPPMMTHHDLSVGLNGNAVGHGKQLAYPRLSLLDSTGKGAEELRKILCEQRPIQFAAKSVEPKEYAQNISDVAAYENLLMQVASLKALFPQAGVTAGANLERVTKRQEYLQAILRTPLAIGFGEGQSGFGWILGPRFTIDSSTSLLGSLRNVFYRPSPVSFVHEPVRHNVRASVALPAWIDRVELCYKSYWLGKTRSSLPCPESHRFQLALPGRSDRWETLSRFLNPDSRYIQATPTITYPDPARGTEGVPSIMIPDKSHSVTHKQRILIRGKNLWRNPEVFLGQLRASEVSVVSDMEGVYATFELVDEAKEVIAALGSDGDYAALTVSTSAGTMMVPKAVRLVAASQPAIWPSASLKQTRLMADKLDSNLTFALSSPLNPKSYSSLHLYVRNVSAPAPQWRLLNAPVSVSRDAKSLEVCGGSKAAINDPCSFPDIGTPIRDAIEVELRVAAKLAVGDPDAKDILLNAQKSIVFFETDDKAKALLSAPLAGPIIITPSTTSPGQPPPNNPISVVLPVYNNKPDLFMIAYPGLEQAIKNNQVQIVLRGPQGHTIVLPAAYQKIAYGQHQFLVSAAAVAEKASEISATPAGEIYEVSLRFDGGHVPVNSLITIQRQ